MFGRNRPTAPPPAPRRGGCLGLIGGVFKWGIIGVVGLAVLGAVLGNDDTPSTSNRAAVRPPGPTAVAQSIAAPTRTPPPAPTPAPARTPPSPERAAVTATTPVKATAVPKPTVAPNTAPTAAPKATELPKPKATVTPKPKATVTPKPKATVAPTRTPRPAPTPRPTRTPRPSPTPRPTPSPTPQAGTDARPAPIGETVAADDVAVTVSSAFYSYEYGYSTPKGGYKLLVIEATIENVDDEDHGYAGNRFSAKDLETQAEFDDTFTLADGGLGSGTLSPGEYVSGVVVLEVQETSERVRVKYDTAAFGGTNLYWEIPA